MRSTRASPASMSTPASRYASRVTATSRDARLSPRAELRLPRLVVLFAGQGLALEARRDLAVALVPQAAVLLELVADDAVHARVPGELAVADPPHHHVRHRRLARA